MLRKSENVQARAAAIRRQRGASVAQINDTDALILIDLSDVLCHAIWHDTCAGIPRVQLEIAGCLRRIKPKVRVFGLHRQRWRDLGPLFGAAEDDVDRIFALLKESFTDFRFRLENLKLIAKKRLRRLQIPRYAQTPDARAEDCLFIGGAFWLNRDVIALGAKAAANGANLVILLHDLIPLTAPSFTGHDFTAEYEAALRLPAHFVVTSEHNRSDLLRQRRRLGVAASRTCATVTPLADEFPGSTRGERPGPAPRRLEMLAGDNFALSVGTIEIRKNHHALIGVWRELARERGDAMPRLVIAGRRGWKAEATLAELDALAPGASVVFIEAPSDAELRWLYASCLFTVFPSFFEGWGLPVGESFWFGKPCAASNAPSIAPVARDLCAVFSPHQSDDMKRAIEPLLDPAIRDASRRRIEATPLRSWADVAADIETVIRERRSASDAIETAAADGAC